MAVYIISDVNKREDNAWNMYCQHAEKSIAKYGGKFLVNGADQVVVEGAESASKIVIVEFTDMETAKAWYASTEYAKALSFKEQALHRRLIFVEGV